MATAILDDGEQCPYCFGDAPKRDCTCFDDNCGALVCPVPKKEWWLE